MQRTESLLARSWLVVFVALLVAIPVLVVGELSANDTRERIRGAALDGLAKAADRAAAGLSDRIEAVALQVSAGSATPLSGKPTPLLVALEREDAAALDSFASYLGELLDPQVLRIIVLDRTGTVVAVAPTERTRLGGNYADRDSFARVSKAAPTHVSSLYSTQVSGSMAGGGDTPAIAVSSFVADLRGVRAGVVVAEVDVRLLGRALTPLLGAVDDIYLIDGEGRLLLRATHAFTPDPQALRDLRDSRAGAAALGGTTRTEADDPLGGGTRLIGIAPVSTRGWRVLAMRSPSALERELDASLTQARATRIALAVVLLLGSALMVKGQRRRDPTP